MEKLLDGLRQVASQGSDLARKHMISSLRDLAVELEKPSDTLYRLAYTQYELVFTEVAINLGVFKVLAEAGGPLHVDEISKKTGADPLLLNRLLRYLASHTTVKETNERTYAANHVTKTLSQPGYSDGIHFHHDFYGRILQVTPQFLKEHNYENITNPVDTPLQKGLGTPLHGFQWIQNEPELLLAFMKYMGCFHEGKPSWTSAVAIKDHIKQTQSSDVLFIDIGGSMGTQAAQFRQAIGDTPGRVLVQDLKETVDAAPSNPGVEMTVHDFFTPQTVKGAKYYFMRNVLHDYPEERALSILGNLLPAMGPDSVLILNELVLPDKGASVLETQQDLGMMITQGAMERTEKEWRALLDKAGMRILRIDTYSPFEGDSVIEAVPA